MRVYGYFDLKRGTYEIQHSEPPCDRAGEVWPSHPWTISDSGLPSYQHCPRCGLRRVVYANLRSPVRGDPIEPDAGGPHVSRETSGRLPSS